jgi:hypothetical protein
MILMAVGSAKEEPLAVELEGTVVYPLSVADAEGIVRGVLASRGSEGDAALVEVWSGRAPELWGAESERDEGLRSRPWWNRLLRRVDRGALGVEDLDRQCEGGDCAGWVV